MQSLKYIRELTINTCIAFPVGKAIYNVIQIEKYLFLWDNPWNTFFLLEIIYKESEKWYKEMNDIIL